MSSTTYILFLLIRIRTRFRGGAAPLEQIQIESTACHYTIMQPNILESLLPGRPAASREVIRLTSLVLTAIFVIIIIGMRLHECHGAQANAVLTCRSLDFRIMSPYNFI